MARAMKLSRIYFACAGVILVTNAFFSVVIGLKERTESAVKTFIDDS